METSEPIAPSKIRVTNQVWTVGNMLSVSRILVLPLLILLHQGNDYQPNLEMKLVVLYMILSDFLDGYASRLLNQVSELGKWLDPLADKVCAIVLFTYVWWIGMVPDWLFGLIVVRDLLIVAGSLVIKSKRGKIAMSVMTGKIAVNVLSLYWLVLVFLPGLEQLILVLKYASAGMLIWSGFIYFRRGYNILMGADYD